MTSPSAICNEVPLSTGLIGYCVAGRYRLLACLGRGAHAAVYRVRDLAQERDLALKVLQLDGRERRRARLIARFEREYHTLCGLRHPNIVAVHDYGVDPEGPFYTMELVAGRELRAESPMPWQRVAGILCDVASALAVVHTRRWIHRDVSTRNVRLADGGGAKLIDFGLMLPQGGTKDLSGTPPFVAPECVQMQELDGRVDLFAMGVLGYYLLTGRYPYKANRFEQLRDAWRTPLWPIQRLAPDVPSELSALIMQLLSLDRRLRPNSVSEVLEKLHGLAQREATDAPGVSAAYLTTPDLVGRQPELMRIRRMVIEAMRVRGRRLVISGERGVGRSRFLDACVLEGKLAGATVVRADAADGASGSYGVLKTLVAQLLSIGDESRMALGRDVETLAVLMPQENEICEPPMAGEHPANDVFEGEAARTKDMVAVRDAVRRWVVALAQKRCVLIAIDDLHRADESSAAVISALADVADGHRLLVMATVADEEGAGAAACRWFVRFSVQVVLEPLSDDKLAVLLRGLFGDVMHLAAVGAALVPLCQGKPKVAVEVAQHLVDSGQARCHAGAWILPARLKAADFPQTVSDVAVTQLAGMSATALVLVQYFAVTGGGLTLDALLYLVDDVERADLFTSLDQLLLARVLETAGDHYRLAGGELAELARRAGPPELTRDVHRSLADMHRALADGGRAEAHHRIASGDPAGAIAPLLRYLKSAPIWMHGTPVENAALLRPAIEAAEQQGLSDATLIPLEISYLRMACSLQVPDYHARVAPLVKRLERSSGLDLFAGLDPGLQGVERARRGIAAAVARFEAEGGYKQTVHPLEAIKFMAGVQRVVALIAATTNNVELFKLLPSLKEWVPQIPFLQGTVLSKEAGRLFAVGRHEAAAANFEGIMAILNGAGGSGVSPGILKLTVDSVCFFQGMVHARLGHAQAYTIADQLEASPSFQMNAWILRLSANLHKGDVVAAHACRKYIELLNLEQRPPQSLEPMATLAELDYYGMTRDASGIHSTLARVDATANLHPSWELWRIGARAAYDVVRGDVRAGEKALAGMLAEPCPEHAAIPWAQPQHILALLALERYEDAARLGEHYLSMDTAADSVATALQLGCSLAVAKARLGRHEEAWAGYQATLDTMDAMQVSGMVRCLAYQTGALLGCIGEDQDRFEQYATYFMTEAGSLSIVAIGTLHAQMVDAAKKVSFPLDARYLLQGTLDEGKQQIAARAVRQAMGLGDGSRASTRAQMLALLLEWSNAEQGALFVGEEQVPVCRTHLEEGIAQLAVPVLLDMLAEPEDEFDDTLSTMETGELSFGSSIEVAGVPFLALVFRAEGGEVLATVLLGTAGELDPLSWELIREVGQALS